jgi:hypothetical protein
MINPELKIGDRVVLIVMEGESNMSYGDRGEVIRISEVFGNKQYKVKWDDDRTLDLLEDADKWMKEEDFDKRIKKRIKESYSITKGNLLNQIFNNITNTTIY